MRAAVGNNSFQWPRSARVTFTRSWLGAGGGSRLPVTVATPPPGMLLSMSSRPGAVMGHVTSERLARSVATSRRPPAPRMFAEPVSSNVPTSSLSSR